MATLFLTLSASYPVLSGSLGAGAYPIRQWASVHSGTIHTPKMYDFGLWIETQAGQLELNHSGVVTPSLSLFLHCVCGTISN